MNVARGLQRVGDPTGKTERDWVAAMRGRPQSISNLAGGMRLLQWRSGRYNIRHIAVLFDAQHRFVKITTRYQC